VVQYGRPVRPGVTRYDLDIDMAYRYGISIWDMDYGIWETGYGIWDMGYRYGICYIDVVIHHIDMVILDIDKGYKPMIWEMTVSIWSSSISIWDILSLWPRRHVAHDSPEGEHRGVAAQVEFESKLSKQLSHCSFKRFVPGAFNVGLIGSRCTAVPRGGAARTLRRTWSRAAAPPPRSAASGI